jgi:hypothetical protein
VIQLVEPNSRTATSSSAQNTGYVIGLKVFLGLFKFDFDHFQRFQGISGFFISEIFGNFTVSQIPTTIYVYGGITFDQVSLEIESVN